ncbi:hypothetical protein FHS70_004211 [Flammeovirga yaeyamensis]|nr:hypothetical protein [Flammeovirga yaeyamensis]
MAKSRVTFDYIKSSIERRTSTGLLVKLAVMRVESLTERHPIIVERLDAIKLLFANILCSKTIDEYDNCGIHEMNGALNSAVRHNIPLKYYRQLYWSIQLHKDLTLEPC